MGLEGLFESVGWCEYFSAIDFTFISLFPLAIIKLRSFLTSMPIFYLAFDSFPCPTLTNDFSIA